MVKLLIILCLIGALAGGWFLFKQPNSIGQSTTNGKTTQGNQQGFPAATNTNEQPLPKTKILNNGYHVGQTFNNCGPAALSMALSYFNIRVSQEQLGQALRPYQVANGDNDDKSVTLEELAAKAQEYNLLAYHRPGGTIDLLKQFIAADIPVIARTWTKVNEDIGHYRIVKGYDESKQQLIQDDSLQGKNLRYSYTDFSLMWEKFSYEYLVLVPKEKQALAEAILGEDIDAQIAWQKALHQAQNKLDQNPQDITTRFNLSIAYFNLGEFQKSVAEFEKVENQLPFRTLWYQIEPIQAYYELGNYGRVFEISERILNNRNRAYSELYLLRGNSYLKQGNKTAAKAEFEKAVQYNQNLKSAREALNSVST